MHHGNSSVKCSTQSDTDSGLTGNTEHAKKGISYIFLQWYIPNTLPQQPGRWRMPSVLASAVATEAAEVGWAGAACGGSSIAAPLETAVWLPYCCLSSSSSTGRCCGCSDAVDADADLFEKDQDQLVDEILMRMTPWQLETRCTPNKCFQTKFRAAEAEPFLESTCHVYPSGQGPTLHTHSKGTVNDRSARSLCQT